jgi:AcrR family transcriptional regulator
VRPRRYGRELQDAIFQAVFEEIIEVGYAKLGFDGVAKRANTGKAAIYRRWEAKQDLVLDAFDATRRSEPPDLVGDVREDLINYFSFHFVRTSDLKDEALRRLLADVRRFPDILAHVLEIYWRPGLQGVRRILRDAAARGEVDPRCITADVLEVVPAMLSNRQFLNWGDITRTQVVRIVDRILLPALGWKANS